LPIAHGFDLVAAVQSLLLLCWQQRLHLILLLLKNLQVLNLQPKYCCECTTEILL
jgi:hypothetical protein